MWAVGKWITDNVLKVLGSTGDTGGSATAGTAMAKANKAIGELTNGTYGLNAFYIKTTSGGVPIVKSVQRGVHAGSSSDIKITISSINPAKSSVTICDRLTYRTAGSSTEYVFVSYVKELTATSLLLSPSCYSAGTSQGGGSWEIVEYY